jgi:hypothetical protein
MPNSPIIIGFLAFGFGACAFALLKGGRAERIGALIILANILIGLGGELLFPKSIMLALDALTATAMLVVAVMYASPWLGMVMLLYAVQFGLHAFYFVMARPRDPFHVMVNNLDFLAILICLAAGTAIAWRRRATRRAAAGPATA